MTIRKHVHESSRFVAESKKDDGTFRVRIITEGKGSSGFYSRELLEKNKDAFSGVLSYAGHPADPEKPWTRPMMGDNGIIGRLGEQIDFKIGDDDIAYLEADYIPSKRQQVREFFDEYADAIGASIYIAAEGEMNDDGEYVVESFDSSDPYASVDAVIAAGRGGRFERAQEAYRAIESSLSDEGGKGTVAEQPQLTENKNEGEFSMELKDIQELVEAALAEALSPVLEALKPAETPEDEVDMAAVVEAAVEAELPKESREAVVESVRAGAKVEEAIAKQVALVKAIESSFESKSERVVEGVAVAGSAPKFSLSALGGK